MKKNAQEAGWGAFTVNVPVTFPSHCELFKFMRERANLTQGQLARKLKTTQSAIARLETSKRPPSLLTLMKVSKACGFSMEAPYFACKKCHKNISDCNCKK